MADPITVGGVTYRVTPEYLANAASDTETTAAQIAEQLAELKKYVYSLEAVWGGVAHGQFVTMMTEYDRLAKMLNDALNGIGAKLNSAYTAYVNSEGQNVKNINNVSSGLPGGSTVPANLG